MRVVIVGAGIVGAACAELLARSGAEVVVVDRAGIAAETSSRCEGNLLVSDKEPGVEAQLALVANRMWRTLAERLDGERHQGQPPTELEQKGGIVVVFDGGQAPLADLAAGQRAIGIEAEPLDEAALRAAEPHVAPDVAAAMWYPQDAQLQPALATMALMSHAQAYGARILRDEVVGGVVRDGRLRGVRTRSGTIEADAVVNCAGPWAGDVAAALGGHAPILPRRGHILVTTAMRQRVHHKVYDGDYVGAVGSGDAARQTSTVVESTPAGTVLIGSSRERVGFDEVPSIAAISEIAAKAVRVFPFLERTTLLRSYTGFRPYAPDHVPIIGEDARLPGLVHASGHEGAGIGLAPATAALVAHAVLGSAPPIDPIPYLPTRPTLREAA